MMSTLGKMMGGEPGKEMDPSNAEDLLGKMMADLGMPAMPKEGPTTTALDTDVDKIKQQRESIEKENEAMTFLEKLIQGGAGLQ